MKLSTPVNIDSADFNLTHQTSLLLIGSCFSQNIGAQLTKYKFTTTINPSGVIYNPISIANTLNRVLNNEAYTESHLTSANNQWISFDHHGRFSSPNKTECLNNINQELSAANSCLKNKTTLLITFGSAWVYEHPTHGIVANCHKIPAKEFTKRLLTVEEIVEQYTELVSKIDDNIIFTVSPVRHSKDGLHENNLSKALLHLAIQSIVENNDNCSYFPAYEIVIDELRDYRFYKDDLIHPTDLAINYVWEKFGACYFSEETIELNKAIQKMAAAANHRPFDFNSEAHQKFIQGYVVAIKNIQKDFPFLNFEKELRQLKGL